MLRKLHYLSINKSKLHFGSKRDNLVYTSTSKTKSLNYLRNLNEQEMRYFNCKMVRISLSLAGFTIINYTLILLIHNTHSHSGPTYMVYLSNLIKIDILIKLVNLL